MRGRFLPLALVLTAAAPVFGCGGDTSKRGPSRTTVVVVPAIKGIAIRDAESALARRGLRWRFGARGKIHDRPPRTMYTSGDEDPVLGQRPQIGAHVAAGTVITLETRCTRPRARCID